VLEGSMTVSKARRAMITARIAQIDHLLSDPAHVILHNRPSRNWKPVGAG